MHAAIFGIAKYGQREMEEADEQQRKVCTHEPVCMESLSYICWHGACTAYHRSSAWQAAPGDGLLIACITAGRGCSSSHSSFGSSCKRCRRSGCGDRSIG